MRTYFCHIHHRLILSCTLLLSVCINTPAYANASAIPSHQQLFELPEFINQIIDTRIRPLSSQEARLKALLDLVYRPDALNLQYANDITRTPKEAIAQRKGNCVSLSFTFAAMARRADLPVRFMESRDPGRWRQIGDNYALERHMTLYLPIRSRTAKGYHVDFQYATPEDLQHKKLSDKRAMGDYYNNRAIEHLMENNLKAALAFAQASLEADKKYDATWLNYGLILRHLGNIDGAIEAYKKAIKINKYNLSAYNNLAAAYQAQNNKTDADKMIKKIRAHRLKNPFYLYALGERSLEEENYKAAIEWFQKAVKRDKKIAMFYLLLAEAHYLNSNIPKAIKTLEKGLPQAKQAHIKQRLYHTLEFLKQQRAKV